MYDNKGIFVFRIGKFYGLRKFLKVNILYIETFNVPLRR